MTNRAPLDNHLTAGIRRGFQQNRVHVGMWRDTASLRLHRLRATDLSTFRGHCGVKRHVLRLERRNLYTTVRQNPAETGSQHGLTDIRTGSAEHECFSLNPFKIVNGFL
jgi:hypothetical protein